jgi:hypothetical protein
MNELVFLKDKEPRIKTCDLWNSFGYKTHYDLKRVIIDNKIRFEERGVYVLERTKPLKGTKGGRPDESFLLNERQFMLLVMLVKNTDESIDLKSRVESEFFRLREELQKLARPNIYLEAIRKDLLLDAPQEWVRLYPIEFYDALTALYGQKITDPRYRPSYCAKITRNWIYEIVLPKELLNEIDEKQKEEKKHTWFNNEGGRIRLARQIEAVTMIARISQGRKDFESRCATMFCGAPLQLSIFM